MKRILPVLLLLLAFGCASTPPQSNDARIAGYLEAIDRIDRALAVALPEERQKLLTERKYVHAALILLGVDVVPATRPAS
jgi:hypothetical protein